MPYFGNWSSQEDMAKDFSNDYGQPLHVAMVADVVFAAYDIDGYEGDALVVYRDGTSLYEVHGSHCSCYGLEGQWEPEAVERDALLKRIEAAGDYGVAARFKEEIKQALSA